MYPETVGRSLEEIEEIFNQGHMFTAWKIGKDVGKKTLQEVVEKSQDLKVNLFFFCWPLPYPSYERFKKTHVCLTDFLDKG